MRGKGIVKPYTGSVTRSKNQALSVVSKEIDACSWPLGAYFECSSANGRSSDFPDSNALDGYSKLCARNVKPNQALSVVSEAIDACSWPLGAYSECSSANAGSSDLPG
ncbi:hypothetical protein Tco_0370529 [Tanacetum coccineum]